MRDITRIPIRLDRLFLINKQKLAYGLFHAGVILSFFSSMYPWFLIQFGAYTNILIVFFLLSSLLAARTCPKLPTFNKCFILPLVGFSLFRIYVFFVGSTVTVMAFVTVALQMILFFVVFLADRELLRRTMGLITIIMACLIGVSLFCFVLFIFGFSFPSTPFSVEDHQNYSFTNYYFFLVNEWDMWTIIPRFQSVFLEPSHMAYTSVFLLMTEVGRWRKWYNIILMIAVLVSFSAEGYVLFISLLFLSKWIQRKNFVRNLIMMLTMVVAVVAGSFVYQDGDNMLNRLIVMRFEVSDGEVAGDNRVTDEFAAEYSSYLQSSDILFGREYINTYASSGFRVFIYQYGIVGTFLLVMFYGIILYNPNNKRAALTALFLCLIHFVVRAHMMWSSCIIPMYFMAQFFKLPDIVPDKLKLTNNQESL